MQNGLDRKLALPLGYSKGLSAEFTQAHGSRSPSELRINELREGRWLYMTILSGG
jgi:hypothetical protein